MDGIERAFVVGYLKVAAVGGGLLGTLLLLDKIF